MISTDVCSYPLFVHIDGGRGTEMRGALFCKYTQVVLLHERYFIMYKIMQPVCKLPALQLHVN